MVFQFDDEHFSNNKVIISKDGFINSPRTDYRIERIGKGHRFTSDDGVRSFKVKKSITKRFQ